MRKSDRTKESLLDIMNFETENIERLDGFAEGWTYHANSCSLNFVIEEENGNIEVAQETGDIYLFGAIIEGWKAREKRTKTITGWVGFSGDVEIGKCCKCGKATNKTDLPGGLWDCGCKVTK